MRAREEVLELFREGLDPMQVSQARGTTVQTTIGYLEQLVGRGLVRRSDVLFSVPRTRREPVMRLLDGDERHAGRLRPLMEALERDGHRVSWEELRVVVAFYDAASSYGDMYEDLRSIECELHRLLRRILEQRFGGGEGGWWRSGIPLDVRRECQQRREEDPYPAPEPWCYADLKHLERIVDKQWTVVVEHLPVCPEDKRAVVADLARLNRIRNQVMHPVRGEQPDEEDFEFVRGFRIRLGFRHGVRLSSRRGNASPERAS
jgi:Helix-turn-helix domain